MLARDLKKTVRQLDDELKLDELFEWMALYSVESAEAEHLAKKRKAGMR